MTIKKLKSIDIINVLSDLVSEKLETTVKLPDVFWNNGFGTEAVLGLLSYMHEEHGFFKCIAYIYKQNEKSRHLLKKIGFKKFDESFFYGDEGYIFDLGNLQNIYFVLQ